MFQYGCGRRYVAVKQTELDVRWTERGIWEGCFSIVVRASHVGWRGRDSTGGGVLDWM